MLEEEEDDTIHMGNAIMTFYAALIDLLGRCAPEMHVSQTQANSDSDGQMEIMFFFPSFFFFNSQLIYAGKGEAIRIRAILRSLIPIEDLVGVISIPFSMPSLAKGKRSSLALSFKKKTVTLAPAQSSEPLSILSLAM